MEARSRSRLPWVVLPVDSEPQISQVLKSGCLTYWFCPKTVVFATTRLGSREP